MATTDASIGYGAVPDTHPQPRPRASKAVFGAAVLCCLVTIALVPPVNKSVLRGSGGIRGHPLSMTSVQLLGAAVVFGLAHVVWVLCAARPPSRRTLYKRCRNIAPVGVVFGLKLGVTNLGLSLVTTELHVLLMATDVLWAALFARLVNGERPRPLGLAALLGCFIGSLLVAAGASAETELGRPEPYAIAMNLLGPAMQGLVVALLRKSAARELDDGETGYFEFTSLKLCFSALAAIPLALAVEGPGDMAAFLGATVQSSTSVVAVGASTLLIAAVQLSFTVLANLTSSTSVGIIGTVKIVPQWLFARISDAGRDSSGGGHVLGVALVASSAVLWAASGGARAPASPPREPSSPSELSFVPLGDADEGVSPPGRPSSPAIIKLGSFP